MQFELPTCIPDESGENTRTCHCAEGTYILSRANQNGQNYPAWKTEIILRIREVYGKFFRDGTFPENSLVDLLTADGQMNVINESIEQKDVRKDECDALDQLDNYLWDKWEF